jgi:hypothetical protein
VFFFSRYFMGRRSRAGRPIRSARIHRNQAPFSAIITVARWASKRWGILTGAYSSRRHPLIPLIVIPCTK